MISRFVFEFDSLIEMLLNKIPQEFWVSTTTIFVDPSAAGGQFLNRIVIKLRTYGHSESNIRSRVVGITDLEMCKNYIKSRDLPCILFNDILEAGKLMIPDVICGNPAYQDANNKAKNVKLYHKVVNNSMELLKPGGYLTFITPATILGETGPSKKMLHRCCNDMDMQSIDYTVGQRFFSNIGVDICGWVLQKAPTKSKTHVTFANGEKEVVSLHDGPPRIKNEKLRDGICEKIIATIEAGLLLPIPLEQGDSIEENEENGNYPYYHSGRTIRKSDQRPSMSQCKKLVVPFSETYTNYFVTHGYVGMLNTWCPIKDDSQYEEYRRSLNTPLIRFFILNWRRAATGGFVKSTKTGFAAAIKNGKVPIVPDVSTEKLYQLFKLTREEIAYFEQQTK